MRWPIVLCAALAGCDGCGHLALPGLELDAGARDGGGRDLAVEEADAAPCAETNACGDCDDGCMVFSLGPSHGSDFPLQTDPMPDPAQSDDGGVIRDDM